MKPSWFEWLLGAPVWSMPGTAFVGYERRFYGARFGRRTIGVIVTLREMEST